MRGGSLVDVSAGKPVQQHIRAFALDDDVQVDAVHPHEHAGCVHDRVILAAQPG